MSLTDTDKERIRQAVRLWRLRPHEVVTGPDLYEIADHAVADAGIDYEREDYRATQVYAVVIGVLREREVDYRPEPGAPRLTDAEQDALVDDYRNALGAGSIEETERVLRRMYETGDAETEARVKEYHGQIDELRRMVDADLQRRRWARPNV